MVVIVSDNQDISRLAVGRLWPLTKEVAWLLSIGRGSREPVVTRRGEDRLDFGDCFLAGFRRYESVLHEERSMGLSSLHALVLHFPCSHRFSPLIEKNRPERERGRLALQIVGKFSGPQLGHFAACCDGFLGIANTVVGQFRGKQGPDLAPDGSSIASRQSSPAPQCWGQSDSPESAANLGNSSES